ncbi:MAG: outer membrane protein assembly factor [Nitrospirae bacterium]|nr:outer membrane protein assembly factor [Candidatus Manganitrophaceae bacterium]
MKTGKTDPNRRSFRWDLLFLTALALLINLTVLLSASAKEKKERVDVEIEGVRKGLLENIHAYLSLEHPPSPPTEEAVRRLYDQAPDEIRKALQALGYYRPTIHSELTETDSGWRARFDIDPGSPVRIKQIDLEILGEGAEDPAFEEAEKKLPLHEGDQLDHGDYEKVKATLQNLAAERGYFDAAFTTHRIDVNLEENSADIVLHYDTGPRYRLGRVRFKQEKEEFSIHLLDRFVLFEPGTPYHTNRLLELNGALSGSDYFNTVEIRPLQEEKEDLLVPLEVTVSPRKQYQLSAGIGYGTDTGPRVSFGWEDRYINPWGHRFRAETELSVLRKSVSATYEVPRSYPPTDKLKFQIGLLQERTEIAENKRGLVGVSRSKGRSNGWIETIFLNYQYETFRISDQNGISHLVLPGITWTRTRSNDPVYPTQGHRLTFLIEGTDRALGSDVRMVQGQIHAKYIYPLGNRQRLLFRSELGATSVSNFNELPVSLRFFAGGDLSVRGYRYNVLGPKNDLGDVIGGRYLMIGSVEYDHRIKQSFAAAVFYDLGNAINHFDDPLKESVGVGLRWFSPVGPIRIDVAYALREPGISLRLHVNMGPDL